MTEGQWPGQQSPAGQQQPPAPAWQQQTPAAPEGPAWQPPPAQAPAASDLNLTTRAGRRRVADLVGELDREPQVLVTGWRKWLHLGPSRSALDEAEDEKWLRAFFPRPIMVAIANPKGAGGKTPTTVGLGSAFGLARGGDVVAWDNNELRGTLADRTFSAHRNTVVDLLARQEILLRGDARRADVDGMLNYQSAGQFQVLGSSQEAGAQITREDFTVTREILERFYKVLLVDTGNNEVAVNWIEAVHNADVLVVPLKWKKDHLLSAARMIETLEGQGLDVARRLVIVGTNGPGDASPEIRSRVGQWFDPAPIVEIPTDDHINDGAEVDWNRLQPATRRAYQRLGATVAQVAATRFLNESGGGQR